MTLAMFGGKPALERPLTKYNSIGEEEREAASLVVKNLSLSGYLGGHPYGGPVVQMLEERWANRFGVTHAIACNSATSGLWAAAKCVEGEERRFNVSPYTMSATVAAPMLVGMIPNFVDIDPEIFNMDAEQIDPSYHTVVTNLFGQAAQLHALRVACDQAGTLMIEDNAQSPLATENGVYAGTIGHIGVFSLNVHKHLQCGEGGVVVTNDAALADKIRGFINHGEMIGHGLGLNLRMTEVTAAIALEQLAKIDTLVDGRREQAAQLYQMADCDWLERPWASASHAFYAVPFLYNDSELGVSREVLIRALHMEGFPLVGGYVSPLYHLRALRAYRPERYNLWEVEQLHRETLLYFENCAWNVDHEQAMALATACRKIEAAVKRLRAA